MAIDYAAIQDASVANFVRKVLGSRAPAEKPKPSKPTKERGVPNQLEQDFASHIIGPHEYEAITFHLSGNCSYTPDWVIPKGFTPWFVEVKGDSTNPTIRSRYAASIVKLKMCAKIYENMPFLMARKKDGEWRLYPVTSKGISRKPVEVAWLNGRAR